VYSTVEEGGLKRLTAQETCDDMADGVEEEELGDDEGFDNHDGGSSENEQEADKIHTTDGVQNHVASTSASLGLLFRGLLDLGLAEAEHTDGVEK